MTLSDDRLQEGHERGSSRNVMWVFGQFLMVPVAAFLYGVDMLIKTMRDLQKVTNQGIEAVVGSTTGSGETASGGSTRESQTVDLIINQSNAKGTKIEEEITLSYENNSGNGLDKNLRDDMLKLVRYKILFVKREYEYAFPEREDLVYDNMDGNAFTAWKVAEFIQELAKVKDEKTPEGRARVGIRVPHKWKSYPSSADKYTFEGYLTGLPAEDKKYLRVFYQVLERYPREKFRHDERQIEVLEEIRDRLPTKPSGSGGAGGA